MYRASSKVLRCYAAKTEPLLGCFESASISAADLTSISTSCSELVLPMPVSTSQAQCTFTHLQSPASSPCALSNDVQFHWDDQDESHVSYQFQMSSLGGIQYAGAGRCTRSMEMAWTPPATNPIVPSPDELSLTPMLLNHCHPQPGSAGTTRHPITPQRTAAVDGNTFSNDLRLDDAVVDSIISQHFEYSSFPLEEASDRDCLSTSEFTFPYSQDRCSHFQYTHQPDYANNDPASKSYVQEAKSNMLPTRLAYNQAINASNLSRNDAVSATRQEPPSYNSQSLSEQVKERSESSVRQIGKSGRISGVKKKGKATRARAKPWTAEEHKRFEESLELYGRNWEQCAKYIGTRRASLVRSHAQKHLIKLWKLGKPLPKKLAETGGGYTLSGKPLLADSASAKSYLIKLPCPESSDISQ